MSESLYDILSISGKAAALLVLSVSVAASEIDPEKEVAEVDSSEGMRQ